MKGTPTYTPNHYVDIVDVWEASRLAYLLVDASVFFAVEPMPDGIYRVYVKEEAMGLVNRMVNHENVKLAHCE